MGATGLTGVRGSAGGHGPKKSWEPLHHRDSRILLYSMTVTAVNDDAGLFSTWIIDSELRQSSPSHCCLSSYRSSATLGEDNFARKYVYEKLTKCPNFRYIWRKKNFPIFFFWGGGRRRQMFPLRAYVVAVVLLSRKQANDDATTTTTTTMT